MLTTIHQLFARALAILLIAAKRLIAQRGLALATLIGLTIAIGLTISVPLYAESVYYNVLSEGLFSNAPRYQGDSLRPPVSLLFRYTGSFTGPSSGRTSYRSTPTSKRKHTVTWNSPPHGKRLA